MTKKKNKHFIRINNNVQVMGSRAVAVGAVAGAAGVSGEAGLAGVPRLLEDLARLSEDKDTADIVFLLGRDETPVYAHRIILQARLVIYLRIRIYYIYSNISFNIIYLIFHKSNVSL